MRKSIDIRDLRSRVRQLLRQASDQQGRLTAPVDLSALSEACGIPVEWRWMVPEGVLAVNDDGLKIYLQSNFTDQPGMRRRQRFTWAHEICHALFYQLHTRPPRPLTGAPTGAALEKLCQRGAADLLIPAALLSRDCDHRKPVSSLGDVQNLAERYDVSVDVVLRRLHETNPALKDDYAILLVRAKADGNSSIDAACYGPWLHAHFKPPEVGTEFRKWAANFFAAAKPAGHGVWVRSTPVGPLVMRRHRRSARSEFLELELSGSH